MSVEVTSFNIIDMTYDEKRQMLTYKFIHNGIKAERVAMGVTTDEEIAEDFRGILNECFAKT